MANRRIHTLYLYTVSFADHISAQTPAPTDPATVVCDTTPTTVTGDYNDDMITFYIYVVEDQGDMVIDATDSTATWTNDGSDASDLIGIEIEYPDGTIISDGDSDPGGDSDMYPDDYLVLGIENIDNGTYMLYYFVGPGFPPPRNSTGTFDITFTCATNQPTTSPTMPPTAEPTDEPTAAPFTTTTPAPTQPGTVTSGGSCSGDYNDASVVLSVYIASECDAIFDASSSDIDGVTLEITDSTGSLVASGNETVTVDDLAAGNYTVTLDATANETGTFSFSFLCALETTNSSSDSSSDDDSSFDDDDTSSDSDSISDTLSDSSSDSSDVTSSNPTRSPTPKPTYEPTLSNLIGSEQSLTSTTPSPVTATPTTSNPTTPSPVTVVQDDDSSGGSDSDSSDSSGNSNGYRNSRFRRNSVRRNSAQQENERFIDSKHVLQAQMMGRDTAGNAAANDIEVKYVEIDPNPSTLATAWMVLIAVMFCVSGLVLYCLHKKGGIERICG